MARNMKYVATTTPGLPVEEVSISGLPSGSSTPASNSITTDMLQDGAVTKAKIASGVIPEAYTLPAATTGALGGVRQAAHVASAAGENVTKAEFEALLDALEASGVLAAS